MSESMHQSAILTGGQVPAHVPGAYPNLSCCGGEIQLVPVEPVCECGHPVSMHQTGEGPWTGWCYGTVAGMPDAEAIIAAGADASEPCDCESPTPEERS